MKWTNALVLHEGAKAMSGEVVTDSKGKMIKLVWGEAAVTVFANQAVVQYDGSAVYLTFGQANPPVIWGETEEEKRQQLEKIDSVTVSPIIRLAMTPDSFRAIAEAMRKHLTTIDKVDRAKQDPQ